jgi:hypothetical protein
MSTEEQDRNSELDPKEALASLELAYREACSERDRLRDARSAFSRQLGPLPVAAGISTGTIAVFAGHVRHSAFLWLALILLVVLVLISIMYSSVPAYRQIRAAKEKGEGDEPRAKDNAGAVSSGSDRTVAPDPSGDDVSPAEWYRRMIRLEKAIYGEKSTDNGLRLPSRSPTNLQDALDRERTGVYAVQLLFVLMIVALSLSQLIG